MGRVLVTGADGVLGGAVAAHFESEGHPVIRTRMPKSETAGPELSKDGWLTVNLARAEAVERAWKMLDEAHLEPAIVIHCAGGFRFTPIDLLRPEDLDFLISANLLSSILLARYAVPGMKARGFGRLVYVGARGALGAAPGMAPYAATKAGVHSLVSSLAEELKGSDITVNAVLPTIIDTPANRRDMPGADFSKWVKPAELAGVIRSLTESSAVSGALVSVPGRV